MTDDDLVRCCPRCDAENHRKAWKCICGHNISNRAEQLRRDCVTVSAEGVASNVSLIDAPLLSADDVVEQNTKCVIMLVEDPSIRFVVLDGQVVGSGLRLGDTPDVYLRGIPNLDMVSSRMARFYRRRSQWYVQHVGRKNWISVNDGECVTDDIALAIEHGSILNLAFARFRVALSE